MSNMNKGIVFIAIPIASTVFCVSDAQAYVDPGTGSYLLQIMSAGVLAALFMIKPLWRSIREGFFHLIGRPRKR